MGRKSLAAEPLADVSERRAAEAAEKERQKRNQWNDDDFTKLVPIYELHENQEAEAAAVEQLRERKKKLPPLRNDGSQSSGLRLSDVKREANSLDSARSDRAKAKKNRREEQRAEQRAEQKRRYESLQGADCLGNGTPKSKRARHSVVENGHSKHSEESEESDDEQVFLNGRQPNGHKADRKKKTIHSDSSEEDEEQPAAVAAPSPTSSPASHDKTADSQEATFIELDDLKPGPVVRYRKTTIEEEENIEMEEVGSPNYVVTTPSDEEREKEAAAARQDEEDSDNGDLQFPLSWRIVYEDGTDEEYTSSEESDGIDLQEESEEGDLDEEDEFLAEDADFINDEPLEEEEESGEEAPFEDAGRGGYRRSRPTNFKHLVQQLPEVESDSEDGEFDPANEDTTADISQHFEIDPEELNDLLEGIEEQESAEEDEFNNSSDEERHRYLDPRALAVKPIGLQIDGFLVDEEQPRFLELQRVSDENYAPTRFAPFCFSDPDQHSVTTAARAFKWIVSPLGVQEFFANVYAQRGLLVHRSDADYNADLFPVTSFYRMFQEHHLEFTKHINVANYEDGVRTTHNPNGRAYASTIRSFLDAGYSIQCVTPQSFDKNLHYICDVLQELFGCFVGANCYFTPKGSSGFAPHYDDIDAFLIQTEGRKKWTVWAPVTDDQWPLESSGNFTVEEMEAREEQKVFEGWLEAGDLLYLPRGFVHKAHTDDVNDSLHVTISLAHKHSFVELLEAVTDTMLAAKIEAIPQIRRNLPSDILSMCGQANSLYESGDCFVKMLERPIEIFLGQFQAGLSEVIPAAVDQVAKTFMHNARPPLLTDYERKHTVHGLPGEIPKPPVFKRKTEVRLLRKHTQRLIFESEDKAYIVHRMQNSLFYQGNPETIADVPAEFIETIELLAQHYPAWDTLAELDEDFGLSKAVAQFLFQLGILMVRPGKKSKGKKVRRKVVHIEEDEDLDAMDTAELLAETPEVPKKKKKKKAGVQKKKPKDGQKPKKKAKKAKDLE